MAMTAKKVFLNQILTSVQKGDLFEKEVADVFRSIPHASVSTHVKIAGKDVDIYVVLKGNLFANTRISIDAKDYGKRIDRERAASEYASYYPLVAAGHVDQFMLVTRHGIVANAKEIFDGHKSVHYTLSELQNLVVDPTRLISEMEDQFSADKLDKYYIDARCYDVDLELSYKDYDLHYNDFIAFCLSRGIGELDAAKAAWKSKASHRLSVTNKYSDGLSPVTNPT